MFINQKFENAVKAMETEGSVRCSDAQCREFKPVTGMDVLNMSHLNVFSLCCLKANNQACSHYDDCKGG